MRFFSNFGCEIIFMCSVDFWQAIQLRDLLVQVAY